MQIKFLVISAFILSGLSGFALSLYVHSSRTTLTPTFHQPVTFVKQLAGDAHAGEKIFKEFCATCHAPTPQINVGAPRIGDKKRWERLGKMGMINLLHTTIKGRGAMPARGGCFECSDAQLQETIAYMLRKKSA